MSDQSKPIQQETSSDGLEDVLIPVIDKIQGIRGFVNDIPAMLSNHFQLSADITGMIFMNIYSLELSVNKIEKGIDPRKPVSFDLPLSKMQPVFRSAMTLHTVVQLRDALNTHIDLMNGTMEELKAKGGEK